MNPVFTEIEKLGIVPVVTINDASKAVKLADALMAGKINCAEVTFRTEAAEESIRIISSERPNMLVGAGTVLTTEQAERAVNAGAKFIVSPGLNPSVVKYCIERNIPIIPGVSNPSDVEQAIELGLDVVKFFPAEQAGGLPYIKAIAAPYTKMRFMPTGGINAANVGKYLAYDRILACGGSWMVKPELIDGDRFEEITVLCHEAIRSALNFCVKHVGVNCKDESEAAATAKKYAALFGFTTLDTSKSVFASNAIEVMKTPNPGTNGHIAVSTTSVPRAAAYLERCGVKLNYDTARYDAKGVLSFIYLSEEIGGFAVHLVNDLPNIK